MKTFVITYLNGSITLNVNNYFAKATLPNIKKMFQFARLHCNAECKSELLNDLHNAKKFWETAYNKLRRATFFCNVPPENRVYFSPRTRELAPRTEKQFHDLQAKLDRVIEILKAENWG